MRVEAFARGTRLPHDRVDTGRMDATGVNQRFGGIEQPLACVAGWHRVLRQVRRRIIRGFVCHDRKVERSFSFVKSFVSSRCFSGMGTLAAIVTKSLNRKPEWLR